MPPRRIKGLEGSGGSMHMCRVQLLNLTPRRTCAKWAMMPDEQWWRKSCFAIDASDIAKPFRADLIELRVEALLLPRPRPHLMAIHPVPLLLLGPFQGAQILGSG